MSENRRSGANPLAYQGVEASSPPQFVYFRRNPTTKDYYNWRLGTIWLNQVTDTIWMLAHLTRTPGAPAVGSPLAVWIQIGSGVYANNFVTGNGPVVAVGGAAIPVASVLNVLGAHGISTGAAANTITVELDNAIILGNLAAIPAYDPALTLTTGDCRILAGNILMPPTTINATMGVIVVNGVNWAHSYGIGNTFVGSTAGNTTVLTAQGCTGIGAEALHNLTSGNNNTACGGRAAVNITSGSANSAFGELALSLATTSEANCAFGTDCLDGLTTGGFNSVVGAAAARHVATGDFNIIFGAGSGNNYVGAESNNIIVGNQGTAAENNSIHIGVVTPDATLPTAHTSCFIAGISGVVVAGAVPVVIDANGQLGTVVSSIRYKEDVEDLGNVSTAIYDLRPVKFHFKADKTKHDNYGLIAEEVEAVMPNLVVYNKENEVDTVRYMDLIPLMLNEIQKLKAQVTSLQDRQL